MRLTTSAFVLATLCFGSFALAAEPEASPETAPSASAAPSAAPSATPRPAPIRAEAMPAVHPSADPTPPAAPLAAPAPVDRREALVGRASAPTGAGRTQENVEVRPGLEVFGQYAFRNSGGGVGWFHEFDVPRVHGALTANVRDVTGRVVLEGVRSASEGALLGVAGNSLVLRLREAFAGYRLPVGTGAFHVAAGVVPTLAVPELEGTWTLRAVTPSPEERTGLLTPADVGVTGKLELPNNHGFIAIGAYNGEGYTNRELNRGKNAELAVSFHPLPAGPLLPLALFAAFQTGSSGTGKTRNDRLSAGLLWQGARVRAGATANHAWGLADDGAQTSLLFDGFLRVDPWSELILGTRASYWIRDTRSQPGGGADSVFQLVGAAGWNVSPNLQPFLAVSYNKPTARAEVSLPGSDYVELRAIARVVF